VKDFQPDWLIDTAFRMCDNNQCYGNKSGGFGTVQAGVFTLPAGMLLALLMARFAMLLTWLVRRAPARIMLYQLYIKIRQEKISRKGAKTRFPRCVLKTAKEGHNADF